MGAVDKLTKDQRRRNMQAIKSTGSKIETILAKALWVRGHRYRKNVKTVPGKPDLIFKRLKIAIFVDGEFWHGKDWNVRRNWIKSNQDFWHKKIERNMRRDAEINESLQLLGWIVLRFWGEDITKNLDKCLSQIENAISLAKKQFN